MNEQEQQQFIQWLAKKTGAKTEQDVKQVLAKLQANKQQFQQVIQQFKTEMAQGQGGPSEEPQQEDMATYSSGGKLSYIDCLKKGGVVDCGCGGTKMKKVKKGQDGLVTKKSLIKSNPITANTNAGAMLSPLAKSTMKKVPGIFTQKEVDNMPGWVTETNPMNRAYAKGGTIDHPTINPLRK